MKLGTIIEKLQELAPARYAMDWDNVGLLAGRADKDVKKVLIALEITDETVEEAVQFGADLIVTHHPLIFKPLRSVTDQDMYGRKLIRMIQSDICYYAMHTNFDVAPGCMADLAAERIGMVAEGPLMVTADDGCGIGKVGTLLGEDMSVGDLAEVVKERFHLPFVTVYGDTAKSHHPVKKIAICPGSGEDMIPEALRAGAEVLITGDIGHHHGLDAGEMGLAVIDAGHYGLEHIFISFMEGYLKGQFGEELCLKKTSVGFPAYIV